MTAGRDENSGLPVSGTLPDDIAAQLQHPVLQRLYQYWETKRAGRMAPSRAEIDPVDFRYAIGWVNLFDLRDGADRFVIRVLGGQMERMLDLGAEFRTPTDVRDPEFHEVAHRDLTWVVENRRPQRVLRDFTTRLRHYRFEGLILPLSDDGETVNMALAAAIPPVGG